MNQKKNIKERINGLILIKKVISIRKIKNRNNNFNYIMSKILRIRVSKNQRKMTILIKLQTQKLFSIKTFLKQEIVWGLSTLLVRD